VSQQHFAQAVTCHQNGQLSEALRLYQQVLHLQPAHQNASHYAGLISAQTGNIQQAAEYFAAAVRCNPKNAQFHYDYGRALLDLKRYEEALISYAQAISRKPDYVLAYYNQGYALQNLQRYPAALTSYRQALALQPNFAEAHHACGLVLARLDRHEEALQSYERAISLQANNAVSHNDRGSLLQQLGRHEQALQSFAIAVKLDPQFAEAYHNLGLTQTSLHLYAAAVASHAQAIALQADFVEAHVDLGNLYLSLKEFDTALSCFQRLAERRPELAAAHNGLGLALCGLERRQEAQQSFSTAIAVDADGADAYNHLGVCYHELERHADALLSYDRAIALRGDYAAAYNNRGNTRQYLQQYVQAVADYQQALIIKPDSAETHNNLGNALQHLKRPVEALHSFDRALALQPDYAQAHKNRGNTLHNLRDYQTAIRSYQQAIALQPDFAEAYNNLGNTLLNIKDYAAASARFEQALALQPDYAYSLGYRLFCKMQICDWQNFAQDLAELRSKICNREVVATPFAILALIDSPKIQQLAAELWNQDKCPANPCLPKLERGNAQPRLRIAYLSADFHNHATAHLTAGLFEKHDRNRFEISAISFGPDLQDAMRLRLQNSFDRFVDVSHFTDLEIAQLLREWEIDIAVDLGGYTKDNRSGVLAMRAAPIQVNFLGYPGTMAADYMDYIVADSWVIPPEQQHYYRENVVYLPDSYQVNDDRRQIAAHTPSRSEAGLPETGFVFCCFNNHYKLTPTLFSIWMRLLQQLDGSVLWLLGDQAAVEDNLRQTAKSYGIAAERLVFAPRLPPEQHLARQRLADLFLDTLPYNAHTTASDALWAGLPVLTCSGQGFAARVAGSLLHAIDLPELITESLAEYEALALQLALNPALLAKIRNKLATNIQSSALFATDNFRQHLETAYLTMWEQQRSGQSLAGFAVPVQ
jgi:predicted O-linked N-acetylglucosamine transferase (SPINDLY family)